MTMPREIILLRHGQSEANVVQKDDNHGVDLQIAAAIRARPDWQQRLTADGREQARNAGDWIRANIGNIASFDAVYYSPFMRTRETAAYAVGDEPVALIHEDRIIERNWGIYGKLTRKEQEELYPRTTAEKKANPMYVRLDGGESLMDVNGRIRDMQGTLHREHPNGRVMMVTHGDFMNAWRYELEYLLPEEWEAMDGDHANDFRNCALLQYSRINPENPAEVDDHIRWMRFIYTADPDQSPNGGEWIELAKRRRYTADELLAQVERSPRLLDE